MKVREYERICNTLLYFVQCKIVSLTVSRYQTFMFFNICFIVDLLFENEGDAGFWPALANLTKKAKCPIILTATTVPQPLVNSSIRFKQLSMTRPTPMECASKMCQISNMEGISWKNSSGTAIKDGLAAIAKICDCDLRRIINEMHLFSFSAAQTEKLSNAEYLDTEITGQELHDQSASIEFPIIRSIVPENVPSGKCSVLTIKGEHFIGTCSTIGKKNKHQFSDSNKIEVYVGGQKCPAAHVLNSSTILAVCPPCHIPDGIDSSGISKLNHEVSLGCKYAQVTIRILSSRGMVLQSDASTCRINDGKYRNIPFISYDFPEYECSMQTRNRNKYEEKKMKARLKFGRAEEENGGFLSSDDDVDCELTSKNLKNMSSKDKHKENNKAIVNNAVVSRNIDTTMKDSESNLSGSRCQTAASEDKMTAQELLEIAVNSNTSIDAGDSNSEESKVVPCSPLTLSLKTDKMDDSSRNTLDYLRSAELSSDAALFDDCVNIRCVPLLSGTVPGFGSDLIDDPIFLRSGGAKP